MPVSTRRQTSSFIWGFGEEALGRDDFCDDVAPKAFTEKWQNFEEDDDGERRVAEEWDAHANEEEEEEEEEEDESRTARKTSNRAGQKNESDVERRDADPTTTQSMECPQKRTLRLKMEKGLGGEERDKARRLIVASTPPTTTSPPTTTGSPSSRRGSRGSRDDGAKHRFISWKKLCGTWLLFAC